MKLPLVSVIMPYYRDTGFFYESVTSVLNQSYRDLELIVIDDCSQDNGIQSLGSIVLCDPRLIILRNGENIGAGLARNRGIDESRGTWLAFCDSDDIWMPNKLEAHLQFAAINEAEFTFSSYEIYKNRIPQSVRHAIPEVNYFALLLRNYIGCSTVMVKKQALNSLRFNGFRNRQDWCLWLDITSQGGIFYGINDVLVIYNKSNDSLSFNKFKMVYKNFAVYHDHLNFSWIKSCGRLVIFLTFHAINLIMNKKH